MHEVVENREADFTGYYQKHYNEMFYVANRIVHNHYSAEDIVQEAFIKAYKNYGHLIDQSKHRAWLRTIVIRTAIDYYRKQTRYETVSVEEGAEAGQLLRCPKDSIPTQLNWQFEKDGILEKIDTLPKGMQEVLKIKIATDGKDQEIADQLNISLSAVKTRLHRARKMLRAEMSTVN
ncbi:RNA polymerase sigma factor [Amphibacillus xylanus]|uniref:RNA polymerase sigma factor n=1 Tax=Amphibacillus xylanus (strain ATCC 51415 / DSM 6626 / JCM 7361 / LMG 17667 / NBRC 15112 / Ep01) TaxID=698758 RepID=K0J4S5_AMPXN|nr:RNA polymerase sigma factor [Amphibacillus xylanus]BAM47786.1 putative RNA polymerase ECF-type sigma factor [Amphibacillus xylanus NBRC 15112]